MSSSSDSSDFNLQVVMPDYSDMNPPDVKRILPSPFPNPTGQKDYVSPPLAPQVNPNPQQIGGPQPYVSPSVNNFYSSVNPPFYSSLNPNMIPAPPLQNSSSISSQKMNKPSNAPNIPSFPAPIYNQNQGKSLDTPNARRINMEAPDADNYPKQGNDLKILKIPTPRKISEDLERAIDSFNYQSPGCCMKLTDKEKFKQLKFQNLNQEYCGILIGQLSATSVKIDNHVNLIDLLVLIHCLNQDNSDIAGFIMKKDYNQLYQIIVTLSDYFLKNLEEIKSASAKWGNERKIKPLVCILSGYVLNEINSQHPKYKGDWNQKEVLSNPDSMWID